jgi:hypothetical protein
VLLATLQRPKRLVSDPCLHQRAPLTHTHTHTRTPHTAHRTPHTAHRTPHTQELWKLAQSKALGRDVLISDKNRLPNFKELVRGSKFCLAPWGHGWGNRLGLYMTMGCVPVIVQVRVGRRCVGRWSARVGARSCVAHHTALIAWAAGA